MKNHIFEIVDTTITCSCGYVHQVEDIVFTKAIISRHLIQANEWPFNKDGVFEWPSNNEE